MTTATLITRRTARPGATAASSPSSASSRAWWPAVAAVAGIGWSALCFAPALARSPLASGCTIAVAAGFAVAAVVVGAQPGRRRAGLLLGLAGLLWPLNTLGGWDVGAMTVARQFTESAFWIVLAAAVLVFQDPRLARPERCFLAGIVVQFLGGQTFWTLISEPAWAGFPRDAWWPTLAPDHALFDATTTVLAVLYIPTALLFAALVTARQRRGVPLDRYSAAPVSAAIAVAGVTAGISWSTYERTTVAVAVVLLSLPAAFIYSATRLRRLRVRLGEALAPEGAPGPAVTTALRTVLRDPSLTVRFFSPERREWVDEHGAPDAPAAGEGRLEIPISRRDGRLSAVVSTVATSPAARRQVEAAVRLSGTAIENAGLHALVRAQVEAVARAHARTLQVGVEERRRLEQDLHDGAQQRLLGVLALLALARHETAGTVGGETVADAETEVRRALAELRELAHGLAPSALARDGLPGALDELTGRLPLPVALRVDRRRLGPALETSLYFVVCEALSNVVKHARADRAWVRVTAGAAGVDLDVRDDGVGGADPGGHGLRGIADRVVALGGRVDLHSDPGTGTHLRVWVPCG